MIYGEDGKSVYIKTLKMVVDSTRCIRYSSFSQG